MNHSAHHREGILLALLAAALWGLTPVVTKGALAGFTPEFLAFVRLALAATIFQALAGWNAKWCVSDPWIWLAGTGLGADFILYNYGMQRTAANVAGLVINIELLSTIAFAVWILGERLNRRRVLGGAVTLAGVLIVSFEGLNPSEITSGARIFGNGLVMLAGISWSLYAVAQRRSTLKGDLYQRLTPIFSIAAVSTAPAMLREGAWAVKPALVPVAMFLVLAIPCTGVVYWIYARAQELIDVSVLSILLCAIPVFAVVFAYFLLREVLTVHLVAGGAVILAGIAVIATEKVKNKPLEVGGG